MSRRAKPYLLIAVILFGIAALGLGYHHRHSVRHLLSQVKHLFQGTARVQAAPAPVLEISGRKFTNVLGQPPYYLEVKALDSVLFVTQLTAGGSNLFHVLNLKTGQDVQIPTKAGFGRYIGFSGGGVHDYIDQAQPGMVVAASVTDVGGLTKNVYYLNLETKTMEARDVFQFNPNGYLTNRARLPGF